MNKRRIIFSTDELPKNVPEKKPEPLPLVTLTSGSDELSECLNKTKIVSTFRPRNPEERKYFILYCHAHGRSPSLPDMTAFIPREKMREEYDRIFVSELLRAKRVIRDPHKKAPSWGAFDLENAGPVADWIMGVNKPQNEFQKGEFTMRVNRYSRQKLDEIRAKEEFGMIGRASSTNYIRELADQIAAALHINGIKDPLDQQLDKESK